MARFEVRVETNKVGSESISEIDVPNDELSGKTPSEINDYVWEEYGQDAVWEMIEAVIERKT